MDTNLRASLIPSGSSSSLESLGSTDSSGSSESASGKLDGITVSIADTLSGGLSALKQKAASAFHGSSQQVDPETALKRASLQEPLLPNEHKPN